MQPAAAASIQTPVLAIQVNLRCRGEARVTHVQYCRLPLPICDAPAPIGSRSRLDLFAGDPDVALLDLLDQRFRTEFAEIRRWLEQRGGLRLVLDQLERNDAVLRLDPQWKF